MKNKNKRQEIFIPPFFIKNKEATTLLPEEVLKIVIAVICIGFLVFLLVALYFSLTGEQNKKYAEASKLLISNEIIRINTGEAYNSQGIPVPNPSGWHIFGFAGGELKPNLCAGTNCFCICEDVVLNVFDWQKRQLKKCDDKGSCFVVSNLKKFDKIKIEKGGTAILIEKLNGEIQITKK